MDVVVDSAGLFSVGTDFTDVTSNVTSNKAKKLNWLYVILDRSDRVIVDRVRDIKLYMRILALSL